MSNIIEIINNAFNSVRTKRTNIVNAIIEKGVDVSNPSSVKLADIPSLIASISGGGGLVNASNSSLEDSYVGTAGDATEYDGTYSKVANTYHRGFNVYRHTTDSKQYYLIAVDDNGYTWKIVHNKPSEDATVAWTMNSNTGVLGPVGTYGGNPGGFEINGTSSSSSSSQEGILLASKYYGVADSDEYGGIYNPVANSNVQGYRAYSNGYHFLVAYNSNGNRWVIMDNGNQDLDYDETSATTNVLGPVGLYEYQHGDGYANIITDKTNNVDTVYVYGQYAESNGYAGTYTKEGTKNGFAWYHNNTIPAELYVHCYIGGNGTLHAAWLISTDCEEFDSEYMVTFYDYGICNSPDQNLLDNVPSSPVGLEYSAQGEGTVQVYVSDTAPSSSSSGTTYFAYGCGDSDFNGYYTENGHEENGQPVYTNPNGKCLMYSGYEWTFYDEYPGPSMPRFTNSTIVGTYTRNMSDYNPPTVTIGSGGGDACDPCGGGNACDPCGGGDACDPCGGGNACDPCGGGGYCC